MRSTEACRRDLLLCISTDANEGKTMMQGRCGVEHRGVDLTL